MSATDSGPKPGSKPGDTRQSKVTNRLLLFGVVGPLASLSIGVDGGDIFQILAIDNLALDPRALGIALGLGTLSIPIQIWATKIPLVRARQNLRLHLWLTGAMALAVAALIALAEPGSAVAGLALLIAIMAEISVSVLMATSFQPVISYALTTRQRQILNGPGRAAKGVALLTSVAVFGQLDSSGRALFMVAIGLAAIIVGWSLHVVPAPAATPTTVTPRSGMGSVREAFSDSAIRNLFIALPATALAGWPLMLSYVALVLWPTVNLGLLGAALALGGILAASLWRDPGDRLVLVTKIAALVLALCSVAVAVVQPGVSTLTGVVLFSILIVGTAARSVLSIGVMELAHRRVDERSSVQVMTMFDVIGSTSFQLGFFVAGFLVAESQVSTTRANPFQIWLVLTAVVLVTMIFRLGNRPSPPRVTT